MIRVMVQTWVTMDPELWDALFGWMTGRQCFLPEGCTPPVGGILIYVAVIVAIIAAIRYREKLFSFIDWS